MTSTPPVDVSVPIDSTPVSIAPPRTPRLLVAGYALTIFLSAFLLFQVQPLIGKFILPWFGGTPGVWTTCMLFFQMLLFGGYLYAHLLTSRLEPLAQSVVHVVLLVAGCAVLLIIPWDILKPSGTENPVLGIVLLLGATVGVPFFVLSSTGPLIQGWFSRTHEGRSPYRLYALSNVGSLLALVTYPFLFDVMFPMRLQARLWSCGFGTFAVLCGLCALGLARSGAAAAASPTSAEAAETSGPPPSAAIRVLWFVLAMVPSALLLATTNQVCLDVASVPFLWVLPLTLYLLSFILCFDSERWYSRAFMMPAAALALGAAFPVMENGADASVGVQAMAYFLALFTCAMVCHGELVRFKPHARYLTSFYLLISAGGAAGGIFVGIIAPLVFKNYFELHVSLFAAGALMIVVLFADPSSRFYKARPPWVCALMLLMLGAYGALLGYNAGELSGGALFATRNFYGVLRIKSYNNDFAEVGGGEERNEKTLCLLNGRIMHGTQFINPDLRRIPTTYYSRESGVGRILGEPSAGKPRHVGLVGLGTGTLAAYARPGDRFRFYEINAAVPQIASTYFHYLGDCQGQTQIIPGDARLNLDREPPQNFDVLVLDAFSGDAIPVHLLTEEAFQIYLRHLADRGIIAVHISNRHFELRPVVDAIVEALHLADVTVESSEDSQGGYASTWVLVARDEKALDVGGLKEAALQPSEKRVLWTDDRSSTFQVLNERAKMLARWKKLVARFRGEAKPSGGEDEDE